jgi:ribose 5-phosphate isomerase A
MSPSKDWREDAKKAAARETVKKIKDGQTIGLGSGSTVAYAIKELGNKIRDEKLDIVGVPSSYQSMFLAIESGIRLTSLDENPELDLAIDGADQVSKDLELIKGGGAALTREKIVDTAAKEIIIIVDESKLASRLDIPVPVEILPFAVQTVTKNIQKIGGRPVLRGTTGKVGPLVTDNNNFIIDADFGYIDEPRDLENRLKLIPGLIETGLFLDMVKEIYVGTKKGVRVLKK